MYHEATHIIGKQVVEIETSSLEHGMQLKDEAGKWNARLLPGLESLFSRYAGGDVHVCIDRINISVETSMKGDWMDIAIRDILQRVEKELQVNIETASDSTAAVSKMSKDAQVIEQLLFFLEKGHLPWWSVKTGALADEWVIIHALRAVVQEASNAGTRKKILASLQNEYVRRRLVNQFSQQVAVAIVTVLLHCNDEMPVSELLQTANKDIAPLAKSETTKQLTRQVLIILLERIITDNAEKLPLSTELVAQWKQVHHVQQQVDISLHKAETKDEVPNITDARPVGDKTILSDQEEQAGSLKNETNKLHSENVNQESNDSKPPYAQVKPTRLTPAQVQNMFRPTPETETEGIYVENAGLVLLAPFLPACFTNCSLLKDGQLIDGSRAVQLVQYLATGTMEAKEYDLTLNKILCGLEISTVLEVYEGLSATEKTEAEQLLWAVIKYWSVLKNTSIEGLRESFLMRSGKLSRKGDDWLLQVEQKSYDMLLEHLPWTIGFIRLPFMRESLFVEWA